MPATQATIGYGAKFYIGAGSPIVYTSVLECKAIQPDDYSVAAIEVTHLLSPNSTKERIAGLVDPGKLAITANYVGDATQQNLDSLAVARTVFPWKITATAGALGLTMTGTGFITKMAKGPFEPEKPSDVKFDIQIAGQIAYAVA